MHFSLIKVHLCETDRGILRLPLNSKKLADTNDKSSPTSVPCHAQDSPEPNHDRIMRKASSSSSSGSTKSSHLAKSKKGGSTFTGVKDPENRHSLDSETVVVVVRSLWRDVSQEER